MLLVSLLFVAMINPYSFEIQIFVLNTSLFTFYTHFVYISIACISMHGYGRSRFISNMHLAIWDNVDSVTGTMIIIQTNIHHRSKLFTTGQARVNP